MSRVDVFRSFLLTHRARTRVHLQLRLHVVPIVAKTQVLECSSITLITCNSFSVVGDGISVGVVDRLAVVVRKSVGKIGAWIDVTTTRNRSGKAGRIFGIRRCVASQSDRLVMIWCW